MEDLYRSEKTKSSDFSQKPNGIPLGDFGMLPATQMNRRTRLGKYLEKVRREDLKLTLKEAQVRAERYRAEIGQTTIRDIERGTANPGIKTVEAIALAYDLDPLEVIGLHLEDPPEAELGFKESQFARLWKRYSKKKPDQRKFVDGYLEMLITKLDELG